MNVLPKRAKAEKSALLTFLHYSTAAAVTTFSDENQTTSSSGLQEIQGVIIETDGSTLGLT